MATPANKHEPQHERINQAVSVAIAGLHTSYYGQKPAQVFTHSDENVVVCMVVEPFSSYEKNLFSELGGVCDVWGPFQESMAEQFKQVVGQSTGRTVTAFTSYAFTDPDLILEMFKLGTAAGGRSYPSYG
jgi:uncharacterized protein YbcI